jgi:hypothetical protein
MSSARWTMSAVRPSSSSTGTLMSDQNRSTRPPCTGSGMS